MSPEEEGAHILKGTQMPGFCEPGRNADSVHVVRSSTYTSGSYHYAVPQGHVCACQQGDGRRRGVGDSSLTPIPDREPVSRLARITPLEVINPIAPGSAEDTLLNEMRAAWEHDWSEL